MIQNKETTILSYKGVLTFNKINDLLFKFKENMSDYDVSLVIKKRIYSVIVECLENTYKHSYISDNVNEKLVEFELLKHLNDFKIKTSNLIDKNHADYLINKIDFINSLDKQELKNLYKKSILKSDMSKNKSAGLGLIEIAKTSNNPIEYKLLENNNHLSVITTVIISNY